MLPTFTVGGSHGILSVDAITGDVLSYDRDPSCGAGCEGCYDDIARFDLAEWARAYPGEVLTDVGHIDILDLGCSLKDGAYEGPEEDWRAEFRSLKKGNQ